MDILPYGNDTFIGMKVKTFSRTVKSRLAVPNVDFTRNRGENEGGAAFFEEGDGVLGFGG
jgi:hypothetical protein